MPTRVAPIFNPNSIQGPSFISEFMKGRAMALAYQSEKQQQALRQQELANAKWLNDPAQRNRRVKAADTDIAYKEWMMQPRPVQPEYTAVQTAGNIGVLDKTTGVMTDSGFASKPSGRGITVTTGKGEGLVVEHRGEELKGFKEAGQNALKSYENLGRAQMQLDTGQVITGTFGDWRKEAWKLFTTLGFAEGKNVAETEAFLATTAQEVANILASGAFGSGTGLSDADREYAKLMAGGSIAISEGGLRKILKIRREIARAEVLKYNKELALARGSDNQQVREYAAGQNMLAEPPPENSGPPANLSPQEQFMWLKSEYAGADFNFVYKEAKKLGIVQ